MKIVSIFATKLFAFHYPGVKKNELKRLLELWKQVSYVYQFVKQHEKDTPSNITPAVLVQQIIADRNLIDDTLIKLSQKPSNNAPTLDTFFKPLHNTEYSNFKELSLRKGRVNYLRIYAIKIDDDCFVITGGAIKFAHLMKGSKHTIEELSKLEKCKQFLKDKGVFDTDSLTDFLNEQ